MNPPTQNPSGNPLEPDREEGTAYTLDIIAELSGVSSQTILHYHEQGIVPSLPGEDPVPRFTDDALRTLRRIEHLRSTCEMNLSGLKLVLGLMNEVDRLHAALRSRR